MAAFKSRLVAAITRTSARSTRVSPPPRSNLVALQHPQERHLGLSRQIPDLIEEQAPARGQLKAAEAPLHRRR